MPYSKPPNYWEYHCAICQAECEDSRTLALKYSWQFNEPQGRLGDDGLWRITTCKQCRSDFLSLFTRWCAGEFLPSRLDQDITVRTDGRIVDQRGDYAPRMPFRVVGKDK